MAQLKKAKVVKKHPKRDAHIYLNPDTYERVVKCAAREHRPSINNMLLVMVIEALEKRGIF